jgi:hypothetical protein
MNSTVYSLAVGMRHQRVVAGAFGSELSRPWTAQDTVPVNAGASDRRVFLAERRAMSVRRFDTVHSLRYDALGGAIGGTHADFIARLAGLVRGAARSWTRPAGPASAGPRCSRPACG